MYTTDLVVLQKIESEWFELEGTIKDHLVHPSLPPPPINYNYYIYSNWITTCVVIRRVHVK